MCHAASIECLCLEFKIPLVIVTVSVAIWSHGILLVYTGRGVGLIPRKVLLIADSTNVELSDEIACSIVASDSYMLSEDLLIIIKHLWKDMKHSSINRCLSLHQSKHPISCAERVLII